MKIGTFLFTLSGSSRMATIARQPACTRPMTAANAPPSTKSAGVVLVGLLLTSTVPALSTRSLPPPESRIHFQLYAN